MKGFTGVAAAGGEAAGKPAFTPPHRRLWVRLWGGRPPGAAATALAVTVALGMSSPVAYVLVRGAGAGWARWTALLDSRIPQLLASTLGLTATVTAATLVLGTSLALLVGRTDLPGRRVWRWLLALPAVIPPYVGAIAYIMTFGPPGWLRGWLGTSPVSVYSFTGVAFVLTMFTYPYVFLITGSALQMLNGNYEEAALSAGLPYSRVLTAVVLPMIRPSLAAGGLLVALYVLSDFGAVAMLRYTTFTAAIYFQMGGFDRTGAAVLSVVLILLTLAVLWLAYAGGRRRAYHQNSGTYRKPHVISLGKWRLAALLYAIAVFGSAVLLPLAVLLYWTYAGLAAGSPDHRFPLYLYHSIITAGAAALVCAALALPLVYLKSRHPSFFSSLLEKASLAGYALPGVIVALGLVFIFLHFLPWFYGSVAILVTAYVIRFFPQAFQAESASLAMVSPRLEEAARNLGCPPWRAVARAVLPLIRPGVLAGAALVFVNAFRELPATLILRPPGLDTLAVRVWTGAGEGFYEQAAPYALIIIIIGAMSLKWLGARP